MRPSVLRRLQSVTGHLQERSPVGVSQAAAADSAASTTANSDELVLTLASGRVSSSGGKLEALRRSSVDLSG
eukprot:COSAG02_NODE_49650_length_325_cov_0.977876_1_plen_71_part_01